MEPFLKYTNFRVYCVMSTNAFLKLFRVIVFLRHFATSQWSKPINPLTQVSSDKDLFTDSFFLIYFLIGGYCFRLLCWFLQYSRVNYLMDSVWYLLGLTAREFWTKFAAKFPYLHWELHGISCHFLSLLSCFCLFIYLLTYR